MVVKMKLNGLVDVIKNNGLEKNILEGNFGLEKENLRVDKEGNIALTKHPEAFGDKLNNPYITVDFAESQVEMITPPMKSVQAMYEFMENLHDIVSTELKDEYLWPQSTPANLKCIKYISPAEFDNNAAGVQARKYRDMLLEKYGINRQLLSGIHYNFSFEENFFKNLYDSMNSQMSYKEFKNSVYLKIARNYTRYRWLIIYLLGASSSVHKSYDKCSKNLQPVGDSFFLKDGVSFRHTKCGYKNKEDLFVSLDSLEAYTRDLGKHIRDGKLSGHREYYSPIRLKNRKNTLEALSEEGIDYLEVRTIDLNPYSRIGVDINDLHFMHLFLLFCLFKDEADNDGVFLSEKETKAALLNQELVAEKGLSDELELISDNGDKKNFKAMALGLIDNISEFVESFNSIDAVYKKAVQFEKNKIIDKTLTYADRLSKDIIKDTFIKFHIEKAEKSLLFSRKNEFLLKGYEDIELSTQILLKAAMKRGIAFDILDRNDNFVELMQAGKSELIVQATKTSLDTYSTVLAMNNKVVSKKMFERYGIATPVGMTFENQEDALEAFSEFKGKRIVVKPKSENFGIGITIFKFEFDRDEFTKAVELAFQSGGSIIIEEFVEGEEYRFLVIGDEVPGILRRVPANITGNGINTISELVEIKNQDPLRGKGYKTPLEKISLGIVEEMFLKQTGWKFSNVPKDGETVFLRENSNISTGGDSVDYTDDISDLYKKIAIETAKSVGAKICGVDMMIKDVKNDNPEGNYSIIEANFNPAIHIHSFPYIGKNRKIADKVLDLLF